MNPTSSNLPFTSSLPYESDLGQSPARNMSVHPYQRRSSCHPNSYTIPPSIPGGPRLPPIQRLQPATTQPAYSFVTEGISPGMDSRNGFNFPVSQYGDQHPYLHYPRRLDQPVPREDSMRMPPSLPRSCSQSGESPMAVHSGEPEFKRFRLGEEAWAAPLEVGAWEVKALAVAKYMNATGRASNPQVFTTDRPACSWAAPGSSPPDLTKQHSRKSGLWQQHTPAYPSSPHSLDDNTRRLGLPSPSPRRPSSVFSSSTLTGSPGASWSTATTGGRGSAPTSPAVTSTTLDFDSRPGSTTPHDPTPTFKDIHDVPQLDLAPRETERTSILERFPMEIFMRIMMHCHWKKQILLRRCNSNMYDMVRLDAIPWETKTAILLHEENFNPRNFPNRAPKAQGVDDPKDQDSDAASCSDDERTPRSKLSKGKRNRGKDASKSKHQLSGKSYPESLEKFACYSCFKILPSYYFEGPHLENNASRAIKGQKKRGYSNQSDKKVDTRVEYVQVISVNPGRPPEWLVKDKAKVRATDVETYVKEYMRKGVNCDDLRRYYKDINLGTHCIAPIRGVNPFFTASSSATPPNCETYRPVYQVEAGYSSGAGVDNSAYTYEICIPEDAVRDENPMERPHIGPSTRICQPQQSTFNPLSPELSAPAPQVKEIIALRRFCILCGAKYGAYRRDCNRRIVSRATEERWWVCACREVRQTGVGRNCPDCGNKVIY